MLLGVGISTCEELEVFPKEIRAERVSDGAQFALAQREVAIRQLLVERSVEAVARDVFLDRCWRISYFPGVEIS